MKPIFCILVLVSFFMFNPVNGQTWERFFGEPGKLDTGRDVLESYDKGYCILGRYDYKYTWLIKTDVNGIYLWDKIIEAEYGTTPNNMVQTSDGGLLIVGGAAVFENIIDPFILKFNACGEKEWCRILRKPGQLAFAMNVVELDDGTIMVQTMYMEDFSNIEDIHIYKFDHYGNLLWRNVYASKLVHPLLAIPFVHRMRKISDGAVMLIGNCYYPDPWNPTGTKTIRPMFVKVDSLGAEEWFLPFGLNDTLSGQASEILELSDKSFIGFSSYWQTVPNRLFPLLCNIDQNGTDTGYIIYKSDTVFNNCYNFYFWKFAAFIEESTFSCLVPHNYQIFESGEGGEMNITMNGNILKTMPHKKSLSPWSMYETSDHKYIQASGSYEPDSINEDIYLYKINKQLQYDTLYPGNYTYDSLCDNLPIQPGFISLNNCEVITGMDEIPTPEEYYAGLKTIPIKVYPNPVRNRVFLSFENTIHHKNIELHCFNLMGSRLHHELVFPGQLKSCINVSAWPQGMYIAVVVSEGRVAGRAKFVVESRK